MKQLLLPLTLNLIKTTINPLNPLKKKKEEEEKSNTTQRIRMKSRKNYRIRLVR